MIGRYLVGSGVWRTVAAVLLAGTVGCAGSGSVVRPLSYERERRPDLPMTVLPPSIEFFDSGTARPLSPESLGADSLAGFITQIACETLDRPSLVCAGTTGDLAPGRARELHHFVSDSKRIVEATHVEGWSGFLLAIAAGDSSRCVVVQHLRASVGPGGVWSPGSGSANLLTHLRTAVVECGSGRVLRKSEIFSKIAMNPSRRQLVRAMRSAYEAIQ